MAIPCVVNFRAGVEHIRNHRGFKIVVSAIDLSKRALVTLVNGLANVHAVALGIARESSDGDVHRAYRKLSKKCHPDKGGKRGHQRALNAAFDT